MMLFEQSQHYLGAPLCWWPLLPPPPPSVGGTAWEYLWSHQRLPWLCSLQLKNTRAESFLYIKTSSDQEDLSLHPGNTTRKLDLNLYDCTGLTVSRGYIYSGTPLNRHPSTVETRDIKSRLSYSLQYLNKPWKVDTPLFHMVCTLFTTLRVWK